MTFLGHSNAIAARRWKSVAPGLELRSFAAATALVCIHIVDAEIVQPHPGTTAGDHVISTVVPLGVAALAAGVYRFLRPGLRAAIALSFGALAVVAGLIAAGGGVSGSDVTGVLLIPAGAALIALGCWTPWRERGRWAATARRRWLNRGVAVVGALVVAYLGIVPVGAALWTTGKFRSRSSETARRRSRPPTCAACCTAAI